MARSVRWQPQARADVGRLIDFLWEKSPKAAQRAASTIMEAETLLKANPRLGRPMQDNTERRELVLPFGASAYIVSYMLQDEETVIILQVWHSRENRRG